MDKDQLNNLAAKIAEVIANQAEGNDLERIRQSVERLNERLDRLEFIGLPASHFASQIHPSREKFQISETVADQLVGISNEKMCTFEPNARPCDNCSMCTSRGF